MIGRWICKIFGHRIEGEFANGETARFALCVRCISWVKIKEAH